MEQLLKKSFKDLADMTLVVADRFFAAKQTNAMKKNAFLAEFDETDNEQCALYINRVYKAFASLNESERNLINNEFFFQGYLNWWESIYSKATFYRYKKKAMRKFLEAFYYD